MKVTEGTGPYGISQYIIKDINSIKRHLDNIIAKVDVPDKSGIDVDVLFSLIELCNRGTDHVRDQLYKLEGELDHLKDENTLRVGGIRLVELMPLREE